MCYKKRDTKDLHNFYLYSVIDWLAVHVSWRVILYCNVTVRNSALTWLYI